MPRYFLLSGFKSRPGQSTVEYLLMLAWIVSGAILLAMLFYKKLLGTFFTIIGMVMGAGTPQT